MSFMKKKPKTKTKKKPKNKPTRDPWIILLTWEQFLGEKSRPCALSTLYVVS